MRKHLNGTGEVGTFYIFPEVLRKLRRSLDIGQEKMAQKLGVHHQTYSRYERGEIIPGADVFYKLVSIGANPVFLATGKGEPMVDQSCSLNESDDHKDGLVKKRNGMGKEIEALVVRYLSMAESKGEKMANVLLEVVFPWIEQNFGPSAVGGKIEAWIMNADNMAEHIIQGDLLLIDTAFRQVEGSGIYAFNDGRKTLIRRIYERLDQSIYICSDNQKYKEESLQMGLDRFNDSLGSPGNPKGLFMIGKVIKILKNA